MKHGAYSVSSSDCVGGGVDSKARGRADGGRSLTSCELEGTKISILMARSTRSPLAPTSSDDELRRNIGLDLLLAEDELASSEGLDEADDFSSGGFPGSS